MVSRNQRIWQTVCLTALVFGAGSVRAAEKKDQTDAAKVPSAAKPVVNYYSTTAKTAVPAGKKAAAAEPTPVAATKTEKPKYTSRYQITYQGAGVEADSGAGESAASTAQADASRPRFSLKNLFSGGHRHAHAESAAATPKPTGRSMVGSASWYGRDFHGGPTASGERYDMNSMTAAHRTLPFGTRLKVTNLHNGRETVVRVNNRGPYVKGRMIDLSKGAAQALGMVNRGVARVKLEVLGQ
jgi:rare lipoprotein A